MEALATEADEDAQHYTSIVIVLISLMSYDGYTSIVIVLISLMIPGGAGNGGRRGCTATTGHRPLSQRGFPPGEGFFFPHVFFFFFTSKSEPPP